MSSINESKQRFMDLTVNEISLVDNPANEEEWLVIKNLGGKKMLEETDNIELTEEPELSVEVENDIKKSDDVKPTEVVDQEHPVSKIWEILDPHFRSIDTEKAINPVQAMALLKKVYALLEPAFKEASKYPYPKAKEAEKQETKKMLFQFTDDGNVVLDVDGIQEISKAKRFTSKRIEKVTNAIKALVEMLKEVSPDGVEKLFSSMNKVELKKADKEEKMEEEKKPKKSEEEMEKEEEKKAKKFVELIQKSLEPLQDRLEKLETVRGVRKSTDAQETTEVKKKSSKSLWDGIF